MAEPHVAVVAGIVATAIFAALLARPIGTALGIETDRAFKIIVASGAILLGLGALSGLAVDKLMGGWQLGQAVGTYAAIGAEAVIAFAVMSIGRRRRGGST